MGFLDAIDVNRTVVLMISRCYCRPTQLFKTNVVGADEDMLVKTVNPI